MADNRASLFIDDGTAILRDNTGIVATGRRAEISDTAKLSTVAPFAVAELKRMPPVCPVIDPLLVIFQFWEPSPTTPSPVVTIVVDG